MADAAQPLWWQRITNSWGERPTATPGLGAQNNSIGACRRTSRPVCNPLPDKAYDDSQLAPESSIVPAGLKNPTNFSPAEDIVSFTGPEGPLSVTGFSWTETYRTLQTTPKVAGLFLKPIRMR